MAGGAHSNDDLKVSKPFDVWNFTAVVLGIIDHRWKDPYRFDVTQALASNGARFYITGRRKEALKKVVELYSSGPGTIVPLPEDITQKHHLKRLTSVLASKESSGIHLLVTMLIDLELVL
ncbi:hypothetical protein MMC26_007500 [Xylographa opegraphella]|nr:hypothetical protein [Xylographa opegraphella]